MLQLEGEYWNKSIFMEKRNVNIVIIRVMF